MILVSVGPGAGALRTPEIVLELAKVGRSVEVVLGQGTDRFVGPAAFATLAPVVKEATEPPEALIFAPATAGTPRTG